MVDFTENDACTENMQAKKYCHDMPGCSYWAAEGDSMPRSSIHHSASSLLANTAHCDTTNQHSPTKIPTIEAIQIQLLSALERINNLERKVSI